MKLSKEEKILILFELLCNHGILVGEVDKRLKIATEIINTMEKKMKKAKVKEIDEDVTETLSIPEAQKERDVSREMNMLKTEIDNIEGQVSRCMIKCQDILSDNFPPSDNDDKYAQPLTKLGCEIQMQKIRLEKISKKLKDFDDRIEV